MADGDLISIDQHRWAVKLLDTHNAASAGPWVEIPAWYNIRSFWCDVPGTDSIAIQVSNAETLPSAATAGPAIATLTGTAGTTTWQATCNCTFRWLRAVKTGTAATTTCIVEAARNE